MATADKEMENSNAVTDIRAFNVDDVSANPQKPIDVNRYATKKTIAQGMLDIALLTANASQLKYILQVGEKHEFYTLMLVLISTSIVLQIIAGIFILLLSQVDYKNPDSKLRAAWLDYLLTATVSGFLVTDIMRMVFGLDPALPCPDNNCSDMFATNFTSLNGTNVTTL